MGDISAEPSMEEILSSIKRIIAEEGEGTRTPARRPQRVAAQPARPDMPPPSADESDSEEVLELREPMSSERMTERATPTPLTAQPAAVPRPPEPARADPIVSQQAAAASRGSLDALTRLIVKPENPEADNTLEGLVRDMLRPMLREWLDARLPEIVEAMVAREIERITGSR